MAGFYDWVFVIRLLWFNISPLTFITCFCDLAFWFSLVAEFMAELCD